MESEEERERRLEKERELKLEAEAVEKFPKDVEYFFGKTSIELFPVRCYTCGKVLSHLQEKYEKLISEEKLSIKEAMDQLVLRECCRTNIQNPGVYAPGQITTSTKLIKSIRQHKEQPQAILARNIISSISPEAETTIQKPRAVKLAPLKPVGRAKTSLRPVGVTSQKLPTGEEIKTEIPTFAALPTPIPTSTSIPVETPTKTTRRLSRAPKTTTAPTSTVTILPAPVISTPVTGEVAVEPTPLVSTTTPSITTPVSTVQTFDYPKPVFIRKPTPRKRPVVIKTPPLNVNPEDIPEVPYL